MAKKTNNGRYYTTKEARKKVNPVLRKGYQFRLTSGTRYC
jgi:hypothetical protein